MIILLFVDLLILYVANKFLGNKWYAVLALGFWALSSAGLSNVMLIRMYLMQTMEVLLYAAVHIWAAKRKEHMSLVSFVLFMVSFMLGGLTHYYFYFFAAAMSGVICIYLLYQKRIKDLLLYGMSLVAGFALNILIFPASLKHWTGYRGGYATTNILGLAPWKFKRYLLYINDACFGKLLPVFLAIMALFGVVIVYRNKKINRDARLVENVSNESVSLTRQDKKKRQNKQNKLTSQTGQNISKDQRDFEHSRNKINKIFFATVFGDGVLGFVGIQGSELVSSRYIYAAIPIMCMCVIWLMSKLISCNKLCKGIVTAAFCVSFCAGSIFANGVAWRYEGYSNENKRVEEMSGNDCLIVCHGDSWWNNIYAGVNVFSRMNKCRYVYDSEIPNVREYQDSMEDVAYVAFINDPKYERSEIKKDLEEIINDTKYSKYEVQYDYAGVRIYRLDVM
jgi:hypothetical protein